MNVVGQYRNNEVDKASALYSPIPYPGPEAAIFSETSAIAGRALLYQYDCFSGLSRSISLLLSSNNVLLAKKSFRLPV